MENARIVSTAVAIVVGECPQVDALEPMIAFVVALTSDHITGATVAADGGRRAI